MIIDLHTHRQAPYPEGIVSTEPLPDFTPADGQFYSIGLHPWHSAGTGASAILDAVERFAAQPWVAAIGECGTDPLKGAPMYEQMLDLRRQVEISEMTGKSVILHAVRSPDIIIGIRRDLLATRPWAIHGFRGKPALARMYLNAGIWLSYGPRFNTDSLRATPRDRLLAETDDSGTSIEDVLSLHARVLGMQAEEYTALIAANTAVFLGI